VFALITFPAQVKIELKGREESPGKRSALKLERKMAGLKISGYRQF